MLIFADFGIDYTEAVEIFSNNKKLLLSTLQNIKKKQNVIVVIAVHQYMDISVSIVILIIKI
jgi:hypothetical protein